MANNEIKTNAEIYREQRKARLAKAAKKKKSGKSDKIIRILVKTLCIVLVIGIVLFGAGKMLTDVFCVPQKLLTAATYGDEKLTVAEYNYYYMGLYSQAVNMASQYDSAYGSGAGASYYDTTKAASEQEYPGDDAPEGVETWADYFEVMAPERGFLIKALYNEANSDEAIKAGFKITEEKQAEIDKQIKEAMDTITEQAKKADYAVNNYIAKVCGEGLTAESYEDLIRKDTIAQEYLTWYQENAEATITEDEVAEYYNKNRADIDIVSFRYFTVSYAEATSEESTDPVYTKAQAKARADQFAAKVTDEATFIAAAKEFAPPSYKENYASNSATLVENFKKVNLDTISEDMGKWTFDTSRKIGEKAIFDAAEQEAYYVVYITSPAHKDTLTASADVRHLLVQADTTKQNSEGESVKLTDKEIEANFAKAKVEADALLKQWKDSGATEEKFIELVKAETDDTASAENGGLYEGINSESSYVPEFLDWSLASHKKGDTGIVKTDYGYHIMYFVGASGEQKWQSDIRSTIASDDYNTYFDGIFEEVSEKCVKNEKVMSFFAERTQEILDRNVSAASSQTIA